MEPMKHKHIFCLLLISIFCSGAVTSTKGLADSHTQEQSGTLDWNGRHCQLKNISYIVGSQKVNWYQAFVLCKNNGMELASITSHAEQMALQRYLETVGYETQAQRFLIPTLDSDMRYMPQVTRQKKLFYLVGSQKVPWFHAFVICKQNGMELASIQSNEEEEALVEHLKISGVKDDSTESFWIGGTRHGSFGSDFVWLASGKPVIYRKFAANQPDNQGNTDNCLELFNNGQDNFSWSDNKCDKKAGFICQTSGD